MTAYESGSSSQSSTQDTPVQINFGLRDESEDGGWYARSDHPLLNDVVLRKVFEHTRQRDLKACRGVCKKWNTSTIPFTRSNWIVRIYGNPLNRRPTSMKVIRHRRYMEDYSREETRGIEEFIQVFSKNQLGIPFARFWLGSFCMTDGVGQEFLKLCGDFAKYINLSNDYSFDVEDVSELLKSAPNLVKFHIPRSLRSRSGNIVKLFPDDDPQPKLDSMKNLKSTFDNPEERRKICPTFVEELLKAGENVSHLTIKNSYIKHEDKVTKCTSLEALTAIEKFGRESCIQSIKFSKFHPEQDHFDLMGKDPEQEYFELMGRMQSKGMKLKRLTRVGDLRDTFYIQMATVFKDTLEHYYSPVVFTTLMDFPTLPHLKSLDLHLQGTQYSGLATNLCNIFPALEKLGLHHYDNSYDVYDQEFFPESEPCPKMKSFILSEACMRLEPFSRILTLFPNLTELELDVHCDGVEILRSIWSEMSQLEVLKLSADVTIDKEDLDSIFNGRRMNKTQDLPSIRNLTNLSQLHLSVSGERYSGDCGRGDGYYLTDRTGYLSLHSMKHIRHLTILGCKFSKTCCEILTTDIGLQSWKFMCRGVHIIPEMEAD